MEEPVVEPVVEDAVPLPPSAALMIAPGAFGVPFQSEIKLGNPQPGDYFLLWKVKIPCTYQPHAVHDIPKD